MRTRRWGLARLVATVVVVVLAGTSAGCGKAEPKPTHKPSPSPTLSSADQACRAQWATLGATADTAAGTGVSLRDAFASRWSAISAGIDYYAKTAKAGQCGARLDQQRTAITQTTTLVKKALPYDAGRRLAAAQTRRTADQALPGGHKEPKQVVKAYALLSKKTPAAANDLAPAYQELAAADPTDAKAVKLALSDIKLLAETSDGYRACDIALAVIKAWHKELVAKAKKAKKAKKKKK